MRRYTSRRKKALRNLAVITIVLAIVFLANKLFTNRTDANDPIVAKVGNEKVFKSEVEKKLQSIFADEQQLIAPPKIETLPKEVVEIVVKEVFIDREILKLAKKANLEKDKNLQLKIADLKDKIIKQAYLDSIIEKEVSKEKVTEKYAEIVNSLSGKKEYQIAHILVKSKEDADKIISELKNKKTKFSDLAKKYSMEQQSAQNGGDLGFILEDNITKEISDSLINLKKEEISEPIKTKLGWHIVKLIDFRDAKYLSFEESKENIKEQLIQNKINEINSAILNSNEIKIVYEFNKEKALQTQEQPENQQGADKSVTPESSVQQDSTGSSKSEQPASENQGNEVKANNESKETKQEIKELPSGENKTESSTDSNKAYDEKSQAKKDKSKSESKTEKNKVKKSN